MTTLNNRYEFILFFDVENGNPNGDPDAGNMPRIDPETGYGMVTDVCLKRKVRNYIELAKDGDEGFNIYVQEKAILNQRNEMAYKALDLTPDKAGKKLPKKVEDAHRVTRWMCGNFFDVRAFGAVMTTEVNCGQVRGPVQMVFARSVDPIVPHEVSITRMAVTTEKEAEKQSGDNRTMGRKYIVPYALYRAEGFVSAPLAAKTGFGEGDLELLWESLTQMFEHDHSAARGKMSSRKLIVFKHDSKLGNAPAHTLFDLVTVERSNGDVAPPRAFKDYRIKLDDSSLPLGVSCEVKL